MFNNFVSLQQFRMEDVNKQKERLRELLAEAMDIAAFGVRYQGIFINQRFSRLRQSVREVEQSCLTGNNIVESKE